MYLLNETKNEHTTLAERRSCCRVPANVNARFFFGNIFYSGIVPELSEKGMFINTKVYIPVEAMFILIFPSGSRLLQLTARVKNIRQNISGTSGMGVELIYPPREYMDIVMKYRGELYG